MFKPDHQIMTSDHNTVIYSTKPCRGTSCTTVVVKLQLKIDNTNLNPDSDVKK